MSLYLLPENQTLIWNTISKVSHFQKKDNKEQWFRGVIQQFYDNTKPSINVQELRLLNKETIHYMVKELKNNYEQPMEYNNFSTNSFFPNNSLDTNNTQTRDYLIEQKQNKINSHFENRQQEYGTMLQKPQVSEIDFAEKKDDDIPLENIDNLLQKQLKEREYEIQPIQTNTPKELESQSPKKIITTEENSNAPINLNVQNLEELEKTPKQVSWAPEIEQGISIEEFQQFKKQMQDFMENMKDEIILLKEEIQEIKQEFQNKQMGKETTEKMKNIMSKLKNLEKPLISSLE